MFVFFGLEVLREEVLDVTAEKKWLINNKLIHFNQI
jgi:hypothetical protein